MRLIVLCFPIFILWKVKITLRKKLLLSTVFGLVGFTIAVTIVRGSIFGGVYKSIDSTGTNEINISWITFWFYVELTVCEYHLPETFQSRSLTDHINSIHHRLHRLLQNTIRTQ